MKIINVDIMQDTSEIVHYDEMGIPPLRPNRGVIFLSGEKGFVSLA